MLKYFLIFVISYNSSVMAFDHSHKVWDQILKKHVTLINSGLSSEINYKNIDKKELKKYTKEALKVTKVNFSTWTKSQQLAYYFNLYNALTVELILSKYPEVKSIKDLGSFLTNPWNIKFFKLFGEKAYLDKIEHELVRKKDKYKEPRLHFAFNCASIGCPGLLKEAFVAEKLDSQLENAMINFLKDRSRNRYNAKKKKLEVSAIFKWYREDFEKKTWGYKSLEDFFAKYAKHLSTKKEIIKKIQSKSVDISFLKYNWNLNDHQKKK